MSCGAAPNCNLYVMYVMDEDEYSSFSQLAVWPKQDDAHDLLGNPERNPMKINMWNILVKVWKMIFLCKWG